MAVFRDAYLLRVYGFSEVLDTDAFHAANNYPDMLFILISGGALAMAFIPVLTEVLTKKGRQSAWRLFSQIANLAFLVTAAIAVLIAVFAKPIVQHIVTPGFSPERQLLVVDLMRLNLVATLIFSISGLVIAGLQANQHFLFPAMAPIFYNIGQIVGILVFAPKEGITIGPLHLPGLGLGERGMVYGVILGAILHLSIQIPGLVRHKFSWTPRIDLKDEDVRKVLRMLGPRLATMFFIQLTPIFRDVFASYLPTGSITALKNGWSIMQVPETLIGTAIGTAILPTLSEQFVREEREKFRESIQRAFRVLAALTIPVTVLLSIGFGPLLSFIFDLDAAEYNLFIPVAICFMVGLSGQSLKEVSSRSFYSQQDARTPLWTAMMNIFMYVCIGFVLSRTMGAAGVSLAESIAFTLEALIMIAILNVRFGRGNVEAARSRWQEFCDVLKNGSDARGVLIRTILGSAAGGAIVLVGMNFGRGLLHPVILSMVAMLLGLVVVVPFIWKEIKQLVRL